MLDSNNSSSCGCCRGQRRWASAGLTVLAAVASGFAGLRADSGETTKVARNADAAVSQADKLAAALRMAKSSQAALQHVNDYEAVLSKQELVGKQVRKQQMALRLRERPFSVYVKYVDPHEGREILYVDGKNNGELLVHGSGLESLAGTLRFSPTGKDALQENRYPITLIGMSNMIQKVIEQWDAELPHGETDVKYFPNAKIGDRACRMIQTTNPQPRPHVQFHVTRLYLDAETSFPIRVEQYAFPRRDGKEPSLVEEYNYSNIRTNLGLTDQHFDSTNPAYNF